MRRASRRLCLQELHYADAQRSRSSEGKNSAASPPAARFFFSPAGCRASRPRLALMAISASINPLFSSARLQVRHKIHKTSHFCAILHLACENKYILIYTSTIYVPFTTPCQSICSHANVYHTSIFKHIRTISALACVIVAVLFIV